MDISTPRRNLVVRFLSVFLLCCTSLYASADQTGKQRITVVANDVTLETVFKLIEKQTGLRFMYAVDAVNVKEKVTVAFERVMLDDVLASLLGNKGIKWVYGAGVILLRIHNAEAILNFSHPRNEIPLINITGKVLDAEGSPVPFATIMIKGGKKGTRADADGQFILTGVEVNSVLLVSSIGFIRKEVVVRENNITIKMNQVAGILGEKVIKGYYSTTTRLNPGNVSRVKAEDIGKQPVSDPLLALQGRVPGMIVTQTTGLPGGTINVQIRGVNSLNEGRTPLFIVDGVPYPSTITAPMFGSYGALGPTISALNFISPSDIESIEVLKDADATAIYGSRGANGVILITTKSGKIGITKVSVNVNSGWQYLSRKRKLLDTKDYLSMRREAFRNDGITPDEENAPDLFVWDTLRYTDWQKELLGNDAHYTDAQLSVSGGNSIIQYLLGGNYHKETTIFPGSFSSSKGGAHFNIIGISPNQRLRTVLSSSYTISSNNFPGIDFANDADLPPNAPAGYNKDGTLNWQRSTWINPYSKLVSDLLDAQTNGLVTNIDMSYRIIPGLIVKANIGYNEIRTNSFSGTTIAGVDPKNMLSARASASYTYNTTRSWISEPQISYTASLGRGTLDLLTGATLLGNKNSNQFVYTGGIIQDALIRFPAAATTYLARGGGSYYKYIAFFGRASYNVSDKYILNLTMRRDGSSRFGPRKRFAIFGAVGGAWIFSEEKFFAKNKIFSFGKLRASYGITGNDQVGDYRYIDQYDFVEQTYQDAKGLRVNGLFNPDFEWERTKKMEVGFEAGFLKDKIFFNISYYRNKSDNQLLTHPLPVLAGNYEIYGNLPIVIRNTGLELALSSTGLKTKKFEWISSFNLWLSRNTLVSGEGQILRLDQREGESLNIIPVFSQLGVDPVSGMYIFSDANGKPTQDLSQAAQNSFIDPTPKFSGGFSNTFKYKGFQLDVFFQYVKQKGNIGSGLYSREYVPGAIRNQSTLVKERWTAGNHDAVLQKYSQSSELLDFYRLWLDSDKSFGDASFIRCKNVSFSWYINNKLKNKLRVNNLRLYVQSQNLFTITSYKGWDPENQTALNIPPLTVFTTGIQLEL